MSTGATTSGGVPEETPARMRAAPHRGAGKPLSECILHHIYCLFTAASYWNASYTGCHSQLSLAQKKINKNVLNIQVATLNSVWLKKKLKKMF